jgi:hypothetical protein
MLQTEEEVYLEDASSYILQFNHCLSEDFALVFRTYLQNLLPLLVSTLRKKKSNKLNQKQRKS